MKPGSLVECIDNSRYSNLIEKNRPYTVREVVPIGTVLTSDNPIYKFKTAELGLRIEEHSGNVNCGGINWIDMPWPLTDFRELQLPREVEEVLENVIELI